MIKRKYCWLSPAMIIVTASYIISVSTCSINEGERCMIVCPIDTKCKKGTWDGQDEKETKSKPRQWCEKEDGTKHGKIISWYENGQMTEAGEYCDGIECGIWTKWNEKGQKKSEGEYCQGQKCGIWTYWYDNGQKANEGRYNGLRCGEWTFWKEDGSFSFGWSEEEGFPCDRSCPWECFSGTECVIGDWVLGEDYVIGLALWCEKSDSTKDGYFTGWFQTGQKGIRGEYCEGMMCGIWTLWWPNSNQKASEGEYCNDSLCGHYIEWHENGQKSEQGYYSDGERCGSWTFWDEDGNVTSEEMYEPC